METVNYVETPRYGMLDSIRGLVLCSMILFHACWDLVFIFDKSLNWYHETGVYIWQQSICWTFIFLSGFCWLLGKKPLKRGLIVFMAGAAISAVTVLFMPENRVVFGVLTLIGSSMLLMVPLHKALKKLSANVGLVLSIVLFVLTRNLNDGYLGFEIWNLKKLPEFLYQGWIMTFLGFTEPDFYSTDYFSLFPWFFLFLSGYFFCRIVMENGRKLMDKYLTGGIESLSFLGRHSLIIYMLHQPIIYGMLIALDRLSFI